MHPATARLSRLLRPDSIATFGGSWSASIIEQCHKAGFHGQLWPVHPERDEIAGLPCYRTVAALPAAPDASFIGVNRDVTIDIVGQLAASGAGGAVCFASGFAEVADGRERNQALLAGAGSMPVLGPNCYGFINYLDGALLWPDQHGGKRVERGVAIITQSSNIAINLTMQKRGLPIAYMLTAGNQAQIGLSGLAMAVLEDERVSALGLHIEGFDDIGALDELFQAARTRQIPIIALKVGRSNAAQSLALSHTASLAGADILVDAFFSRHGVARVNDLDEFIESLKLLHLVGVSPNKTVASMSCSGGEASLVADIAERFELDLRPLNDEQAARIKATLPPLVTVSNPLDYHTFSWGNEEGLTATFRAMLECHYGMTMLVLDFPRADRCVDHGAETSMAAAIKAVRQVGGRLAVVSSLVENMRETQAEELMQAGIVPLMGITPALGAIAHAAWIGEKWRNEFLPAPLNLPPSVGSLPETYLLDEVRSKAILHKIGIATPAGGMVKNADEALALAQAIHFPVVVKAVGHHLAHKSEQGAVKLGLTDACAVRQAIKELEPLSERFLVEEMIDEGIAELLFGVTRDPQFGLYLTIGCGGVLVELWRDVRQLLLPTNAQEIRTALLSLKFAPLLQGFRGRPSANMEAVIDMAMKLGQFAIDAGERLEELDINPLIITQTAAIAADALIRQRR